jgi:hypothetical protein
MSMERNSAQNGLPGSSPVSSGSSCTLISSEDSPEYLRDTDPDASYETAEDVDDTPLGEDDFEVLRKMVQEYKAHRIDFSNLRRRPKFKGPKVNSGIAINAEIRRRVLERAKADPDGTGGGNLSGLIELLLWTFLGCPGDVVDKGSGR